MDASNESVRRILEQYPDEASAERYFEQKRWPNGARCPRCGSSDVKRGTQAKRKRQLWYCGKCICQFSVTSGTILDSTQLPLQKWIVAAALVKDGISARALASAVSVAYSATWHLRKRILHAVESGDILFSDSGGAAKPLRLHKSAQGDQSLLRRSTHEDPDDVKYDLMGAELTLDELAQASGRSKAAIRAALRGGRSTVQEACFGNPVTAEPGDKFDLLTVESKDGAYRRCLCACGERKRVRIDRLKSGDTRSCGCLRKRRANK